MRARNHTNPFTIRHRFEPLKLSETFPDSGAPLCYEVGFGRGVFLRHYAKNNPTHNIVGIEVRKSIADVLEKRLAKDPQDNIHIAHGNGEIALEDMFEDQALDKVFVFHPDPWFKKKHNKRRVINPNFLTMLTKKMKPGAKLYISTDVTILWEAMIETLSENDVFTACEDTAFWTDDYITHWQVFSEKESRSQHQGTFLFTP